MRAATVASGSSSCFSVREILVHVAHERVEMDARLAADGDRREEAVHEEALAAPDAAPQVDAARHVGGANSCFSVDWRAARKRLELVAEPLQPIAAPRACAGSSGRAARREDRREPVIASAPPAIRRGHRTPDTATLIGRVRRSRAVGERMATSRSRPGASVGTPAMLEIQRPPVDRQRGFLGRLGQRRMGVADARQVFARGAELHRHHAFGDELRRHTGR